MFIVLLRLSTNQAQTGQFADPHMAWVKRGFDDGVFLLAGTLQPKLGGAILAHNISRADLEARLKDDPFVANDVVSVETLEFAPSKASDKLQILLA